MKIDLTKLNGSHGNSNYYAYSNQAEAAVLDAINLEFGRKLIHIPSNSVLHGDFEYNNELGDVKFQSCMDLCIEISQIKRGDEVPGWYCHYKAKGMKWILFINPGKSDMYGRTVRKVRLVLFQDIVDYIDKFQYGPKTLKDGSKVYFINSRDLRSDGWLGHFEETSQGFVDTDLFRPNPRASL